jgi:3alpha(or 20beta)-hydroxysteroid dehydrogenase
VLLEDKVVIVTGAARGAGAAMARLFAAEGARVVATDVLDDRGEQVAADGGDRIRYHHLDVTDEDDWATVVAGTLAAHGRVDALVNNAAILHVGGLDSTSLDDFRRLYDVNTVGAAAGIKAVAGPMRDAGAGSIVNISSIDGMIGMNGVSAYAASKWALRGLTKAAAQELGRHGIRVNAVCPANGNPEMFAPWAEGLAGLGEAVGRYVTDRALPRTCTLDEVAEAAAWLVSDRSSFCTGTDLVVDGGHHAGTIIEGFDTL